MYNGSGKIAASDMRNAPLLRASILAAALGAAVASQADVRYSFTSGFDSFELVVPNFITATTSVPGSGLESSSGFLGTTVTGVRFEPDYSSSASLLTVTDGFGDSPFLFSSGAFGSYGVKNTLAGVTGTLTVSQAVPEPASLAALGLGAAALLRRRKRA